MPFRVAAIDIHKNVLMVVVATAAEQVVDVAGEALEFEQRRFGASAKEREHVVSWLQERGVMEVVMESTAQYWKPVWLDLEPHFPKLHLAQAYSNRAPKGRKSDFVDAKRLGRRLLAGELILSFVPDAQQRGWRTITRSKCQLVRDRVQLQNQLEAALEEMRIKLSSVVSDLLGVSGRRILTALSKGETDPLKLAALGDERLKCSRADLADALRGSPSAAQLKILKLTLQRLAMLDKQIEEMDKLAAEELKPYQDAVTRVAEVPGFGVDSAQQLIAEVGVNAEAFASAAAFASWAGLCPGTNVSAEKNHSSRSAKGNPFVRRILIQAAQAAVRKKGSHWGELLRRFVCKLGYKGAICAVAHRLGRVLWKILHEGVQYKEQGEPTNPAAKKRRAQKLLQKLRNLGYAATLSPLTMEVLAIDQA